MFVCLNSYNLYEHFFMKGKKYVSTDFDVPKRFIIHQKHVFKVLENYCHFNSFNFFTFLNLFMSFIYNLDNQWEKRQLCLINT